MRLVTSGRRGQGRLRIESREFLHHPFVFAVRQRRDIAHDFDMRRYARGNLRRELLEYALAVGLFITGSTDDSDDPSIRGDLRHLRLFDVAHAIERESNDRAVHRPTVEVEELVRETPRDLLDDAVGAPALARLASPARGVVHAIADQRGDAVVQRRADDRAFL